MFYGIKNNFCFKLKFLDETKLFIENVTRDVPNPFFCGTELTVNRLQELCSAERDLYFQISADTVSLRFEDSRSELPDLQFAIFKKYDDNYVELLSAVTSGYDPNWVPTRQMRSKTKRLVYKLLR